MAEKYFSEKIIPSELKTASKDLQQDLGGWSSFFNNKKIYCIQVHCRKAVHCHVLFIVLLRILIRIRIRRIRMFLGLLDPDPDPLVRGMDPDPDPSIIKQK